MSISSAFLLQLSQPVSRKSVGNSQLSVGKLQFSDSLFFLTRDAAGSNLAHDEWKTFRSYTATLLAEITNNETNSSPKLGQ